jgi:hypothetical protein
MTILTHVDIVMFPSPSRLLPRLDPHLTARPSFCLHDFAISVSCLCLWLEPRKMAVLQRASALLGCKDVKTD